MAVLMVTDTKCFAQGRLRGDDSEEGLQVKAGEDKERTIEDMSALVVNPTGEVVVAALIVMAGACTVAVHRIFRRFAGGGAAGLSGDVAAGMTLMSVYNLANSSVLEAADRSLGLKSPLLDRQPLGTFAAVRPALGPWLHLSCFRSSLAALRIRAILVTVAAAWDAFDFRLSVLALLAPDTFVDPRMSCVFVLQMESTVDLYGANVVQLFAGAGMLRWDTWTGAFDRGDYMSLLLLVVLTAMQTWQI
jgi:hypothetical protein